MEDYRYLDSLRDISPQNDFIRYIIQRVNSNDYRGVQCSQHNRLTFGYFKAVIDAIYAAAGEERFAIHVGDDNGIRQPAAKMYYGVVEEIDRHAGKGTINSVKKNTFPDIARMGFLERFGRDTAHPVSELGKRRHVFSVRLSPLGLKFARAKTPFEQLRRFTDGVDRLTQSAASELADLFWDNDFGINGLHILEFMYILSDDRAGISFHDKLRMLLSYRALTEAQRADVHACLRAYCNPDNRRSYNYKPLLRDYSNWKNEAQQIYGLLGYTVFFHVVNDTLVPNTGEFGLFFDPNTRRSQKGKTEYFAQHGVEKRAGYELHHIVPFSKAQTKADALLVDDFKNFLYLSNQKHTEFSAAHTRHVILSHKADGSLLSLRDEGGDFITVAPDTDALFSPALLPQLKAYNEGLLRKFGYHGF